MWNSWHHSAKYVVAMAGLVFCVHCSHPWDDYAPSLDAGSPSSGAGGMNTGGMGGGMNTGGMGGESSSSGSMSSASSSASSTSSSSASSSASSASSSASSASSSASSSSGGMQTTIFKAEVAECISPTTFDPDACEASTGVGEMSVDTSDSVTLLPIHSFIRFDIDDTIANKTIDAVTLRLQVTGSMKASSTQSGEIWRVQSFTESSLKISEPAKVGMTPIGMDKGAVTQNQVLTWSLPTDIVAPNQGVFLGVFPLSSDGVNYYNTAGAEPPRLTIQYH